MKPRRRDRSQPPDYDRLISPLAELMTQFINGDLTYNEFQPKFRKALSAYEAAVADRAYWPLDVIAKPPKHCKPKLREYCEQALDRLPKEALDRSTRVWVEANLISDDDGYTGFSFFDGHGKSRFGNDATIYSTRVDDSSFLLSALNGTIVPPPFRYVDLLNALREVGGGELATWVYGTEPDSALAVIERIWSLGNAYQESDQLVQLERQPAPEGGGSFLMLLPKSKLWMLMNEFDYESFTISLHGSRQFILGVTSQINASPEWEARPQDE